MEWLVATSFGPARRSWSCEFRLGAISRGVSRRFRRGMAWESCHGQVGRGGQKSLY